MLHVVCSGLYMYISYVCVCVGGEGGSSVLGLVFSVLGLVFVSKCTEFFWGEVKVDHIRRSWCDWVKVFDIVAHVYIYHCAW